MRQIEMCSECGGLGYYAHDYFGNDVGEKVACLECFGWGYTEVSNDNSITD